MSSKNKDMLRLIHLGGMNEVGMNCSVVETNKDMLIVDAGMGFGDDTRPGINKMLPNLSYVVGKKKKLRGIVITHSHLDHIGALPYILELLDFPTIYASFFASEEIKVELEEHHLAKKVKIKTISNRETVKLGKLGVKFIRVTHSVPDAMSVLVNTHKGNIFFSGDFKFDDNPINTEKTDYKALEEIGKSKRCILGILDSTNSFNEGESMSEGKVKKVLKQVIERQEGRVLVGTFSSEITRIHSLIEIAKELNKKVVLWGRSILEGYDLALKTGFIESNNDVIISDKDIKKYDESDLMFIVTGTQGEKWAALTRMVRDEFPKLKLKDGDTVILSSSIVPGNHKSVVRNIDKLIMKGVRVVHREQFDVHTSGHAHQDEQKKMLNLVQPKYAMPGYADARLRDEHRRSMTKWGFDKKNILMSNNGEIFEYENGKWLKKGQINVEPIISDGEYLGTIKKYFFERRLKMKENGVIFVFVKKNSVYVDGEGVGPKNYIRSHYIEIKKFVSRQIKGIHKNDIQAITKKAKSAVKRYAKKELDKEPVVVVHVA